MSQKIVISNDEFPEFYIEVKPLGDRLVISIYDNKGELLVETAVKERYPHIWK